MAGKDRDVTLNIQKCASNIPKVATKREVVKMVRNVISFTRRYAGTRRNEVSVIEINVNFIILKAPKKTLSESPMEIGLKIREDAFITCLVTQLDLICNQIFRGKEAGILLSITIGEMIGKIMRAQEMCHTQFPLKLLDQTEIF